MTEPKTLSGAEGDSVENTAIDPDLRELVRRARAGDAAAAYEVLGRPVAVDDWVAVLRALAKNPATANLELAAHRALRRPTPVVVALLDLARAAHSPAAAFLARVIADNREEEDLRSQADALRAELSATFNVSLLLAGNDALGALYTLLSRPLVDQTNSVSELRPDEAAWGVLAESMRAEYERLQEVARDTRWRSGSYRHALRHALADLALIAGVGGRLEEQAFRLLQQRTEDPAANADLLSLVSPELRTRYVDWALDRSSAEASPARALFALDELGRTPDAVDRKLVQRLLISKDFGVAAAAAVLLVRTDPEDGANDRDIAELIAAQPAEASARIIDAIVTEAPQRLRLELWPRSADAIVSARAAGDRPVLVRLSVLHRDWPEADVRLRALQLLTELGPPTENLTELARETAQVVLNRPVELVESELKALVLSDWLCAGVWAALASSPVAVWRRSLELLVVESSTDVWPALGDVHASLTEAERPDFERLILDLVSEDVLPAYPAESGSPPLLAALSPETARRVEALRVEVARLRSLVALGDRAAEIELEQQLRPLVERAVERSAGNARLAGDYAKLSLQSRPESEGGLGDTDEFEVEVERIVGGLKRLPLSLRVADGAPTAELDDGASSKELIRALALVDHRLERSAPGATRDAAMAVLGAIAAEGARYGLAEEILRDLFERGPLFPAAIALSADARAALLTAAVDSGMELPVSWREHDVLGGWVAEATGDVEEPDDVIGTPESLVELQRSERERREVEARLEAGRSAAKHAFLDRATAPLVDLEHTADTYAQLWSGLSRLGVRQIALLGQVLRADELNPNKHEIVGESQAPSFVVRSSGVEIDGEVVKRARVEGVH